MDNHSLNNLELSKFKRTRQEWQDPTGEFRSLHVINPIRIEYIKMRIKEHFNIHNDDFSKLMLIDVGCGGGLVCEPMHGLGVNVTGLDVNLDVDSLNQKNIKKDAKRDNGQDNDTQDVSGSINYLPISLEEHLESALQYDIVLCLEVVEHVDNLQNFVNNLTKLLKPGGMMIISTINKTVKSYCLAIVAAEYIFGLLPKGTHDYNKFLKPSMLGRMLSGSSVQIRELTGLSLGLPLGNWHLSSDISVNYFAVIK